MSESLAGFRDWAEKDKADSENDDVRLVGTDPELGSRDDPTGVLGEPGISLLRRTGCRLWSCRAFASAFSCVLTKCASRLINMVPSSDSIWKSIHMGTVGLILCFGGRTRDGGSKKLCQ